MMARHDGESMQGGQDDLALVMPALKEAIAGLLTCQRGIRRSIFAIQRSLDFPLGRGAGYRDLLLSKMRALKRLSVLCNNGARRLAAVAAKARRGCSQREVTEVLKELRAVGRFIADQLQSERVDASRFLRLLRGHGCAVTVRPAFEGSYERNAKGDSEERAGSE